jgi:histidine ammonia-lyase
MPASAETALTGAGKEDHVSMGGFSARKAVQVVENVQKILAIELMLATHALQIRCASDASFRMPEGMRALLTHTSALSPPVHDDRYMRSDFDALLGYIRESLPYRMDLVNPQGTAAASAGDRDKAPDGRTNVR